MADKDAQSQHRIITHMNNDHHDSIVRYLQHFGKLSSISAYYGRVEGVDLNALTLSCQGKTYRIPFEPPISSYREVRGRVVELDKECTLALQADVTVTRYLPPTGPYAIEFVVILATFLGYSQRWWFQRGQVVERMLGPTFADFSWHIQPWLLGGFFLIHGAEMLYFASTKLPQHSVNPRSTVFWLWTLSTLVEGQFAFKRFSDMVTAQREKQKH